MAVEGGHDEQHGKEHAHQADDDGRRVRVDDEDDAAACAEGPNSSDDAAGSPHGHNVVVPQSVEDSDVPADGKTGSDSGKLLIPLSSTQMDITTRINQILNPDFLKS